MFTTVTADSIPDFPEFSYSQLKELFTGTYQLSQAISYLAEMTNENNEISGQITTEALNIISAQARSRNIGKRMYNVYVQYIPNSTDLSGIQDYTCECANGKRTVGCCSHIAAVIYYLSRARYLSRIVKPAGILTKIFDQNNIIPVINEGSDED